MPKDVNLYALRTKLRPGTTCDTVLLPLLKWAGGNLETTPTEQGCELKHYLQKKKIAELGTYK